MSNLPQDNALIVEGPRPWGPPTEVTLGQVERRCSNCNRPWDRPDRCAHCGSFEFTETVIRPKGMVITGPGIAPVTEVAAPKVEADPGDLASLRDLVTALGDVEETLVRADAAARRLVNVNSSNFKVFARLQEGLNLMCSPGDYIVQPSDPLKAVGLRQMLRPVADLVDRALSSYEESKK